MVTPSLNVFGLNPSPELPPNLIADTFFTSVIGINFLSPSFSIDVISILDSIKLLPYTFENEGLSISSVIVSLSTIVYFLITIVPVVTLENASPVTSDFNSGFNSSTDFLPASANANLSSSA